MAFTWILLPLAYLAFLGFSEWLKFKKQAAQIGDSTVELEGAVATLEAETKQLRDERRTLVRRIENLEAIVTSEAWEALGTDRELAQAKAPLELPEPDDSAAEEQVARLARRLRQ